MDRQRPELKTEDVQLPPIFYMSYPVLKRVLQYVYGSSEGSAALQCRLVCKSFNDVMLRNVRLHLNYRIRREPNRCQVVLKGLTTGGDSFPTDQLINSSLIDRIFTMKVVRYNTDFLDEGDLVRLASGFSRTVDVSLFSFDASLPLLPLAEMPQIRVVEVEMKPNPLDLTAAELNFLANLPHLSRLSMSWRNLMLLNQRVDLLNISELKIRHQADTVQNLDINFRNLQTNLPHLVKCDMSTLSVYLPSEVDNNKRLLTSMSVAMPELKELRYYMWRQGLTDLDEITQLILVIFQSCPATVKYFKLNISTHRHLLQVQSKWKWFFRTLFTGVLDSNATRVSFDSHVNPIGCGLEARPFQYKKSRSGVQVGQPVATMNVGYSVYQYRLKKTNGQICTLQVIHNGST